MATQSYTLTSFDFTSAGNIRAWGSQVSTAIQNAGLTKTSDTGQINWTTATSSNGYEIYQFNDTLQSSAPVSIKVQYSNASPWPYISSLTVGQGSDGAGGITGPTAVMSYPAGTQNSVSTGSGSWAFRFNYNATLGFFGLTQWDSSTDVNGNSIGPRATYTISRSCDTTGSPTGNGLYLQSFGHGNGPQHYAYSYDTGTMYNITGAVPAWGAFPSLAVGTNVQVLRQVCLYPAPYTQPQVLYYATGDIPKGTTFSLSPYGTSYTYVACGGALWSSNAGYAMLWQ